MPKETNFEEYKYIPAKCESCQYLDVLSGDWVPYGSTNVQLPDQWECSADWAEEGDEQTDNLIEQLFCSKIFECPRYLESPRCEKHPEQFVDKKYGCSACEEEYMNQGNKEEI